MAKYMLEEPHTPEECLKALDETLAKGLLDKAEFGCNAGVHNSWTIVEAASDAEAKEMVPSFLRAKARVVKLNKFTPEQLKEFHKK